MYKVVCSLLVISENTESENYFLPPNESLLSNIAYLYFKKYHAGDLTKKCRV